MARNKFFVKILIVFSAAAVLLAACGSAQPGNANYDAGHAAAIAELVPGNPQYEVIKNQVLSGLVPGNSDYSNLSYQILAANPAPACPAVDQTSCQSVVDVYPAMCAAPIAAAQTAWTPSQAACQQVGFGYSAVTVVDSALALVEANEYYCYIPVLIVPTATPKPKVRREGGEEPPQPPSQPPCVNCPQPPPVEPPCATCPSPPGD